MNYHRHQCYFLVGIDFELGKQIAEQMDIDYISSEEQLNNNAAEMIFPVVVWGDIFNNDSTEISNNNIKVISVGDEDTDIIIKSRDIVINTMD